MVNSLTNYGQTIALHEDSRAELGINGVTSSTGGILKLGDRLRLYLNTSTPHKTANSATWNEVANGNGYLTGGIASLSGLQGSGGAWTVQTTSGNVEIQLTDQTWTAVGGSILNIAGAYLTDSSIADNNVLAWWERSSQITLATGDSITADNLIIRLT